MANSSTSASLRSIFRLSEIAGLLRRHYRLCVASAMLLLMVVVLAWWQSPWRTNRSRGQITAVVRRTTLPITVHAGGELQSARTVDIFCEVEGETKMVEMLAEGTVLAADQVVIRLDPSQVNDRLAQQKIKVARAEALEKVAAAELKIQQNLAESTQAQAELALTLAELDKKKYLEGDYGVETNDLQGLIALAEADLQEAQDLVEHYKSLVKKGFRTPEQLGTKKQALKRAVYTLSRDKEKLHVLQKFTRERQVTELTAKAKEAKRELERAKSSTQAAVIKSHTDYEVAQATAQLEREQLAKLEKQLQACDVRAPMAGTLVYASRNNKPLELGETIHFKQKLFSVPDMSRMEVRVFVHESVVIKVTPGLATEIRVEAFPNLVLRGSVAKIASFYDGTRQWLSGGVKDYETRITINELPDIELKPGMTAEVEIRVATIPEALIVPLQAVVNHEGEYVCYIEEQGRWQPRRVSIGENNQDFVQITDGLRAGENVALNARTLAARQLRDEKAPPQVPSPTRATSQVDPQN